jgi:uncharacterized protein DUF1918
MEGRVGDRVILESERTGQAAREGKIVEVLGAGEVIHYRVRWEDGHEEPTGEVSASPTWAS